MWERQCILSSKLKKKKLLYRFNRQVFSRSKFSFQIKSHISPKNPLISIRNILVARGGWLCTGTEDRCIRKPRKLSGDIMNKKLWIPAAGTCLPSWGWSPHTKGVWEVLDSIPSRSQLVWDAFILLPAHTHTQ